ncbi:MAG TPA: hypothetical protein VHD62_11360 [Opitutaceae bacterium]|nr:hypothetical protein [Opitutaceae bacterium]
MLVRFFAQNAQTPPAPAERTRFAANLWALVAERGLPPALATDEQGAPGEMSEAECAPLVARVLGAATEPWLAEAARQLVKACFYPEFKTCRDSFREVAPEGSCRRQELVRVRRRVSGAHCVDCPYWVALAPAPHEKFLARHWRAGAADLAAHREIFLPEDFRALRRRVRELAREGPAKSA